MSLQKLGRSLKSFYYAGFISIQANISWCNICPLAGVNQDAGKIDHLNGKMFRNWLFSPLRPLDPIRFHISTPISGLRSLLYGYSQYSDGVHPYFGFHESRFRFKLQLRGLQFIMPNLPVQIRATTSSNVIGNGKSFGWLYQWCFDHVHVHV